MFDLEQSIAAWRKQMLAAGIKTPVPLEELESHLREDVEHQIQSGLNAAQAFAISVRRLGHAGKLQSEFKKTCGTFGHRWLCSCPLVLASILLLNLAGLFIFHRNSSVFFLDEWWSAWFPNYVLWGTFSIIRLAIAFANWRSQLSQSTPKR